MAIIYGNRQIEYEVDPKDNLPAGALKINENSDEIATALSALDTGKVDEVAGVEDNIVLFGANNTLKESNTALTDFVSLEGVFYDGDIPAYNSTSSKLASSSVKITTQEMTNLNGLTFTDGQKITWNTIDKTIDIPTGSGAVLQAGQENLIQVYNDTGGVLYNGMVVYPDGSYTNGFPHVQYAQANSHNTLNIAYGVLTETINDGEYGFVNSFGKVRGINTSTLSLGAIYISATVPGGLTSVRPEFPNYKMLVGVCTNIGVPDGEIIVDRGGSIDDTFHDAWDGAIRESFDFRVTATGGVVTGTLTNPNADNTNLTCLFSDGFYTFDLPTKGAITLTAGTATIPQMNYVYIDQSTKVLTVSTSDFPITEHAKIAKVLLLDATITENEGALRNQNINDHIKSDDDNGHILHIAERVRTLNADWENGVEASLTGTTTNVYFQTTGGQVWQMHKQTFIAQSMPTDDIHVINDPTTPYRTTSNLNDITEYSDGTTWNNEWSNLVLWGVANKTGETSHLMVNLPRGGYNSEANAIEDSDSYTNYTIPRDFRGVGFLIGRFTIRRATAEFIYNGGNAYLDLRGFIPNNTAGGGSGGSGVTSFLGLSDVPSSYTGEGGKVAAVNVGETGLEFISVGGTGTVTNVGAGDGMDFTAITASGNVTLGTPATLTASTANAVTTTSHTHDIAVGIADTNIVRVDQTTTADSGDYAKFTSAGLESRTEAEVKSDLNLDKEYTIITETTISRTLGLSDISKPTDRQYIRNINVALTTFTVPLNATTAVPVGSMYEGCNASAGGLQFSSETIGVTINSPNDYYKVTTQFQAWSLIKVAIDEWDLIGAEEA